MGVEGCVCGCFMSLERERPTRAFRKFVLCCHKIGVTLIQYNYYVIFYFNACQDTSEYAKMMKRNLKERGKKKKLGWANIWVFW